MHSQEQVLGIQEKIKEVFGEKEDFSVNHEICEGNTWFDLTFSDGRQHSIVLKKDDTFEVYLNTQDDDEYSSGPDKANLPFEEAILCINAEKQEAL